MRHGMYPHVFAEGEVGSMTTRNNPALLALADDDRQEHGPRRGRCWGA